MPLELENAIERAVVFNTGSLLAPEDWALHSLDLQQQENPVNHLPCHDAVEHHKMFLIRGAFVKTGGSRTRQFDLPQRFWMKVQILQGNSHRFDRYAELIRDALRRSLLTS